MLDLDSKQKFDFTQSEEFTSFQEILVVSQIRKEQMSDQDSNFLFFIDKSIYKGVRNILI